MRITVNKLDNGYTIVKTFDGADAAGKPIQLQNKLIFTTKELLLAYLTEQL